MSNGIYIRTQAQSHTHRATHKHTLNVSLLSFHGTVELSNRIKTEHPNELIQFDSGKIFTMHNFHKDKRTATGFFARTQHATQVRYAQLILIAY